jgi:hypothetical protein
VLSNWAWVYYHVPLLAVSASFLATDDLRNEGSRRHSRTTLVALAANGIFLLYVLTRLLRLRRDRELYFGGYDGFIVDTVQSLVRCSLAATMDAPAIVRTTTAILVASVGLMLPFAARQWVWYGRPTLGRLGLLLTLAIVVPLVGHYVFGAVLPIERAALYYVPLYAVLLIYALNVLHGGESWTRLVVLFVTAISVAAAGWSFFCGFTARSSCVWWLDRHNYSRETLELIRRDRAERLVTKPVNLRATWRMEPSLNYYRKTRGYKWLHITTGPAPRPDYLYVFAAGMGTAGTTTLASYPDVGMVLLRVNHAGGR